MSIQDLVSKSLDIIRQEMFDRIAAVQEEYAAKGWLPLRLNLNKGVIRGLIELWCWGLWQLYQFLAVILAQAFPDTATGLWLDLHCRQVGITRKPATKARGTVYFVRTVSAGNVPIPSGRVVRTRPDGAGVIYRYITTAAAIIPDGALEVAVEVEAEEYGAGANATVGQISEISTIIPGIDGVENRVGWLIAEGSDREEDEPLRIRYVLAWQGLSGCTYQAYLAWALSVTGVVSARILDQHPRGQGTIDVVIQGTAGLPTEGLVAAVDAKINGSGADDELTPINDDVLVKGPTPVDVAIVAELVISSGDPATILAEAENRERSLFGATMVTGITPFGVGADATLDRLKWPLLVPGVKKVNLTSPVADVTVAADGLAVLESLELTFVWADEE
ncbi:baseplate J/gp47 family protein [Geobacter sp. SVR]|uniref:baseplate J/gp47 family protein n=1 Tax=Geobacter sp. SVR TaxID=2495594 RepID=UPI00143EFEFC|nr:baseplate J/gp47 family protein [Geobacter sp. SVR]BCS54570.1 baseplate assembly protein [Geobacter sp. SVR]GCF86923.1 baseplate assembly protein [Geobacter sp. SVR]